MSRITVIAMLKAREGLEERVNQELLKMVEETHKENGCLQYDLHRSVEDPSVFVFYETWENRGCLDKHFETAHFLRLSGMVEELFEDEPVIQFFDKISAPKQVPVG
jgi:quinol monooxygenase YgiN